MYTELDVIIKKAYNFLNTSYSKVGHNYSKNTSLESHFGGFTDQDWINVGNDLRRGILNYGKSKSK